MNNFKRKRKEPTRKDLGYKRYLVIDKTWFLREWDKQSKVAKGIYFEKRGISFSEIGGEENGKTQRRKKSE